LGKVLSVSLYPSDMKLLYAKECLVAMQK